MSLDNIKYLFYSLFLLFLFPTTIIFARIRNPFRAYDFATLIDAFVCIFWSFSAVIAILVILVGAFFIMTSAGDPKRVKKGVKSITYALLGLIITMVGFHGNCLELPPVALPPQTMAVSPNTAVINIGGTETFSAIITPATANQNVFWSTSDPSIGTIDTYGNFIALSTGNITIIARSEADARNYAIALITVVPSPPHYLIWTSNAKTDGHIGHCGGRSGAISLCKQDANRPSDCIVGTENALLSISSTDQAKDILTTNLNLAWYSASQLGRPQIALDFNSLWVGAVSNSVGTAVSPWTFSHYSGTLSVNCAGGTSSAVVDQGFIGDAIQTNHLWFHNTHSDCSVQRPLYCFCKAPAPWVAITSNINSVIIGTTQTLTAVMGPVSGGIIWSVDDPTIGTINPITGEITGHTSGTLVVTATSNIDPTIYKKITVTITPVATGLLVSPPFPNVIIGEQQTFSASFIPTTTPIGTLNWTTDTPSVGTIDAAGKFTAHSIGTVKVTVTEVASGIVGTTVVTVIYPPLTGITITPTTIDPITLEIGRGKKEIFDLSISPVGAILGNIAWDVNPLSGSGSIDPVTGEFTALVLGTVEIIATSIDDPAIYDKIIITVIFPPPTIKNLAFDRLPDFPNQTFTSLGAGMNISVSWHSFDSHYCRIGNLFLPTFGSATATAQDPLTITCTGPGGSTSKNFALPPIETQHLLSCQAQVDGTTRTFSFLTDDAVARTSGHPPLTPASHSRCLNACRAAGNGYGMAQQARWRFPTSDTDCTTCLGDRFYRGNNWDSDPSDREFRFRCSCWSSP